ncbi:hypothetical protein CBS101457_004356 [Exobasidium rhododendri]|nr:hypothetical protein CBS101457_004356 [Exobasidium rhododendri]
MSEGEDEDDQYDFFESSLESLFGQHQPASGRPGQRCRLELDVQDTTTTIEYRIPTNVDSGNTRLFAHYQWDAGAHLAKMLYNAEENEIIVRGKIVLELGAGSGLPSLVSALSGALRVVITDYPDEGIIATIVGNISLSKVDQVALARGLDWSDEKQVSYVLRDSPDSSGYDLILCADVLWLSSSHAALLRTIRRLLKRSDKSRIVLLSGFHTGRRALLAFYRLAAGTGLCCDWERKDEGVFEYNVTTKLKRPWSGKCSFPCSQRKSDEATEIEREGDEDNDDDNMDDYTERTKWLLFVSLRWSASAQ